MHVCVLGHVQLLATPWTIAHQAPLTMEFSKQEYQSELPFTTPQDVPDLEIELTSLATPPLASRFFYHCATGETKEQYGVFLRN